jgi:hypothetical protein
MPTSFLPYEPNQTFLLPPSPYGVRQGLLVFVRKKLYREFARATITFRRRRERLKVGYAWRNRAEHANGTSRFHHSSCRNCRRLGLHEPLEGYSMFNKFFARRDPYEEYMALKSKLQALIDRGEDESPQGEELRASMDKLWFKIPEAKRQEINKGVTLPHFPE